MPFDVIFELKGKYDKPYIFFGKNNGIQNSKKVDVTYFSPKKKFKFYVQEMGS